MTKPTTTNKRLRISQWRSKRPASKNSKSFIATPRPCRQRIDVDDDRNGKGFSKARLRNCHEKEADRTRKNSFACRIIALLQYALQIKNTAGISMAKQRQLASHNEHDVIHSGYEWRVNKKPSDIDGEGSDHGAIFFDLTASPFGRTARIVRTNSSDKMINECHAEWKNSTQSKATNLTKPNRHGFPICGQYNHKTTDKN